MLKATNIDIWLSLVTQTFIRQLERPGQSSALVLSSIAIQWDAAVEQWNGWRSAARCGDATVVFSTSIQK